MGEMTLAAQIKAFWGANLRTWTAGEVAGLAIPTDARRLLKEVGLPVRDDWTLRFDVHPQLRVLAEGVVIGYDYESPFVIGPGGRIWLYEGPDTRRFVNGTLATFLAFLARYQQYRDEARGLDERLAIAAVAAAEHDLRMIEREAVDDPASYWTSILEQMQSGQL